MNSTYSHGYLLIGTYGLIWVCSSPDFAGRYSFGLKVLSKMNLIEPLQFLALITPVTVPKRAFEKSFWRPMQAVRRFSKNASARLPP